MKNFGCRFWLIFLIVLTSIKLIAKIGIGNIFIGIGWLIFFGLLGVLLYVIFIRTFTCTKD